MNLIQAVLLGIIQGITEFLPISSSAHLVIVPYLLGWRIQADQTFPFDVLVQLGTLLSLIIYFRKDLLQIILAVWHGIIEKAPFKDENSRLGWLIMLATIPAGLAGALLKSKVEAAFSSPAITAFFLFGTAFLLVVAEVIGKHTRSLSELTWKNALIAGFFQAISIFPGVSRSGSCIAGGMVQNYKRKDAARFSFLMAIPIMLAAGLLGIWELLQVNDLTQFLLILLVGFISAAVMGYLVIHWLLGYLNKHSLFIFAGYCIIIGALVLSFSLLNPQKLVRTTVTDNPSAITIHYPSSLSWLVPIVNTCNQKNVALPLVFNRQNASTQPVEPDISFSFESGNKADSTKYILGYESLQVVVNKANPLAQLNQTQVKELFKGTYNKWADFLKACDQCTDKSAFSAITDKDVQVWGFPATLPEQKLIIQKILSGDQLSLFAYLAPDAGALREALQINPAAIGILPAHWVNTSVKTIVISDIKPEDLRLPILVSISTSASQIVNDLVLCIQTSLMYS